MPLARDDYFYANTDTSFRDFSDAIAPNAVR